MKSVTREQRELARIIRKQRLQRSLTASHLAELTNISQSQLSRYENAKAVPNAGEMIRLANALNMPLAVRAEAERSAHALRNKKSSRFADRNIDQQDIDTAFHDSKVVRFATNQFVPPFAQTPSMIWALADIPVAPKDKRQFVAGRMRMQASLMESAHEVVALLHVDVLTRPTLSHRQWLEQLYTIIPRAKYSRIDLGVIPEGTEEVFDFTKVIYDDEMVVSEDDAFVEASWNRGTVRETLRKFDKLTRMALWDGQAEALINDAIARFESTIDLTE